MRLQMALLVSAAIAGAASADPLPPAAKDRAAHEGPAVPGGLPASRPSLTLYLFDVKDRIGSSFAQLAAETNAIFREMGVEVAWRRGGLGTVYGQGDEREIPVIVLDRLPGNADQSVMGLVLKSATPVAVWIYAENIKRTLGMTPTAPLQAETAELFGLATGRVVAHEVVHALAPELGHTRDGLMSHALTRASLTGKARPPYAACAERVRAAFSLRREPAPTLTTGFLPPSY